MACRNGFDLLPGDLPDGSLCALGDCATPLVPTVIGRDLGTAVSRDKLLLVGVVYERNCPCSELVEELVALHCRIAGGYTPCSQSRLQSPEQRSPLMSAFDPLRAFDGS